MDLTSVKKIMEFTSLDQNNIADSVNSYLKEGWFMLYCGTETGDDNSQYARIILGSDKQ
ncbi:MAG: hypothetical protein ACI4R5_04505 [Acetatifactor sp.]